jgi:nitroreductase
MTSPTIEQIYRHGSVRKYRPEPLPQELVETIVRAAQRSSTSSNLQLWTVVAVRDESRRDRLAELCGNQEHIREAPVYLAWCADLARLDRVAELRGYTQVTNYLENFLVAVVDAAIASQTAALAAESLGLGICYIGGIRNNPGAVAELLDLPRLVFPVAGMTLGWPAHNPPLRPRLDLTAVLHSEQYNHEQDDLLGKYDRDMIATGIYQGRQVPVPGTNGEMEAYGWMEHSARRISQPARIRLRAEVEEQGFALE